MPVTPTSKIQLTCSPALPAECVCCKKSANGHENFIDFGVSLDWYGAILFCPDCAKQLLDVLDFTPVAEVSTLREKIDRLEKELAESMEEAGRLQNALDSILIIRPDLHSNSNPVYDVDYQNNEKSDGNPDETESGPSESVTERGPKDVSQSDKSKFRLF